VCCSFVCCSTNNKEAVCLRSERFYFLDMFFVVLYCFSIYEKSVKFLISDWNESHEVARIRRGKCKWA